MNRAVVHATFSAMALAACSRAAQSTPGLDSLALRSLVTPYVVVDSDAGGLGFVGRFRELGATTVQKLLQDTTFCDGYMYVKEGRACWRYHHGEPFQIRLLSPDTSAGAARANYLLRASAGLSDTLLEKAIPEELIKSPKLECATYFVNEVPAPRLSLDSATLWTTPRGTSGSGLGCVIDGHPLRMPTFTQDAESGDVQVWDLFSVEHRKYLLVDWNADECSVYIVYLIDGDVVRLLGTTATSCL